MRFEKDKLMPESIAPPDNADGLFPFIMVALEPPILIKPDVPTVPLPVVSGPAIINLRAAPPVESNLLRETE